MFDTKESWFIMAVVSLITAIMCFSDPKIFIGGFGFMCSFAACGRVAIFKYTGK